MCTVGKSAGFPRRLQVRNGTVSGAGKPFGVSVDVYRGQVGGGSAPAAGTEGYREQAEQVSNRIFYGVSSFAKERVI